MRSLLTIIILVLIFSVNLCAQKDFITLDKQSFDYYLNGDYKNLKKTGNLMLSQGLDYYYLRMRLGILAYNNQLYSNAFLQFNNALKFNSLDTISKVYIYYCYLFSGRNADSYLYLKSIPEVKRSIKLKSLPNAGISDVYAGSSIAGYDVTLYETNSLNYEAIRNIFSLNAGIESFFLSRFKGTFNYTYYRKTGTIYSPSNPTGMELNFNQNQVYTKLSGCLFPGWEFSGFTHLAFFSEELSKGLPNSGSSTLMRRLEYLVGLGISKNGWKIRTGANLSNSNFSNSNQIRGEGYLTWLPFGNLNLYLTSGGMYQYDRNWGGTYQINEEIGLKVLKFLWCEPGIVIGNSFLYARNQGYFMNNSFHIPAKTIYCNFIILAIKKVNITVSPFFSETYNYSWDLNSYTRSNKLINNSFGCSIKLTYNIRKV